LALPAGARAVGSPVVDEGISMSTPVVMPRFGETVESCQLVKWLVEPGQHVEKGSPIATIETDKAEFDVEAPVAGTVLALFVSEGADVPVLVDIAAIGDPDESVAPPPASDTTSRAAQVWHAPRQESDASDSDIDRSQPATEAASTKPGRPIASPRAQRSALDAAIDINTVVGTGPQGRITQTDVEKAIGRQQEEPEPSTSAASHHAPVRGARKIIAERMRDSLATTAQLSLVSAFDASSILDFRAGRRRNQRERSELIPTVTDIIVFEAARSLLEHRQLNAHYLGDSIAYFDHVDMGIAVDTPKGLLVPVLRKADTLALGGVSEAIAELSERARQGRIDPGLLHGSTFTVTNMGTMGIEVFTPILNPPEVAILGIGAPVLRPVEREDGLRHIRSIGLSLTIDHQAVDGGPAARFLQTLVSRLEHHPGHVEE